MRHSYLSDSDRLNYSDSVGPGLPVIFLHPTPLNGDYWQPMIAGLEGVRALVPDLRGHGRSELGQKLPAGAFTRVPDAPVLSMSQLASDILALLDQLQIRQAVFAGCSIGGYALLELWRRAPQRMRGLAFVCSKPQPDAETNLQRRAATIAQARAEGVGKLFDGIAQSLTGTTAQQRRPQIVAEVRAQMTLSVEAMVAVQAGLAARPDSLPTVSSITAPVLAIAGGEDAAVTPAEMEAFCAAPGGCTSIVVEDAGHLAAFEQPEKIASLIGDWLQQFR
ncbi:MAG: alpha/beta fold hydrolase [Acidobacteriota bacterium]